VLTLEALKRRANLLKLLQPGHGQAMGGFRLHSQQQRVDG